ncbi:MAG TPA: XRE family transcriptional regulator [Trinickia sp.]
MGICYFAAHVHLQALLLGMPQPKLPEMLRGKFRGISQAKMIECLNRLRRDVEAG